ncbi:MAG: ABC transporter ATP-binding protein [Acidobacteria bacterium]|nr:ABC transporter ATP-binding protein [Acidobacteriota bacterium]
MTALPITTTGLGKRFGRTWALRDCTFEVPEHSLCALVGGNGAGKTTLLRMLAGLSRPTTGELEVAGRRPADDPAFLADVGFLAQEIPLYRRWTAEDHLAFGAHLNPRWDGAATRDRLRRVNIPLERRIEALSGGMRAQVALALALGKRPRVLLLDEPVAALDPLARRDFLGTLTAAVADEDLTVLLSSHLLADLERVCDHLVLLSAGHLHLCADIEEIVAAHKVLTAPARETAALERDHHVIHVDRTPRQVSVLARMGIGPIEDGWHVEDVGLEEIVLAYLGRTESREVASR